jgi:HAD superfamily hydrolase (TIGR01509 family)
MPGKKIKAVLFDLGETLLSFGRLDVTRLFRQGARLSYEYLKSCGQPVGSFEWYCWQNLIRVHIRRCLSHVTGRDFDMLALLQKIGAKKGIMLEPNQWQHLAWLWYEPLSKIAKAEPNLAETLAALKKSGLKLGVVSNTFVNRCCLDKHLEQIGILEYFTVRLYSCEFDFRKPDPRIFKLAAEKIGEAFENILFVGDHIRNDVEAAIRIGIKAVLIAKSGRVGLRIPKGAWKINHLAELPGLIEKINAGSL